MSFPTSKKMYILKPKITKFTFYEVILKKDFLFAQNVISESNIA